MGRRRSYGRRQRGGRRCRSRVAGQFTDFRLSVYWLCYPIRAVIRTVPSKLSLSRFLLGITSCSPVTRPESLEDLTETPNPLPGRFRLPLVPELESYFFNSAGQLSTSVKGSLPSFRFPLLSRNFFPSAVTSKGPYSRWMPIV